MRLTTLFAVAALWGCTGPGGGSPANNTGNDETDPHTAGSATLTAIAYLDGSPEQCLVNVADESDNVETAESGTALDVPAEQDLLVYVGDDNVTDSDGKALHPDDDGALWTSPDQLVTLAVNETASREFHFNAYLGAELECHLVGYVYDDTSPDFKGEVGYDESFDAQWFEVLDGERLTFEDATAIGLDLDDDTLSVSGTSLVLKPGPDGQFGRRILLDGWIDNLEGVVYLQITDYYGVFEATCE